VSPAEPGTRVWHPKHGERIVVEVADRQLPGIPPLPSEPQGKGTWTVPAEHAGAEQVPLLALRYFNWSELGRKGQG
jgi:hypothetical protein